MVSPGYEVSVFVTLLCGWGCFLFLDPLYRRVENSNPGRMYKTDCHNLFTENDTDNAIKWENPDANFMFSPNSNCHCNFRSWHFIRITNKPVNLFKPLKSSLKIAETNINLFFIVSNTAKRQYPCV